MRSGVGAAPPPGRSDALCAALLLVAGTSLCMQTFSSGKWGARPSTEDEFVYLFQARTLAAGRLTYPSPPLPEFFEAAHILVVPRFAAKYLPGHAAVLAPFQAAGAPWLAPCLRLGGRVPPRMLAWALPPLLAGGLAVGVVCKAATGSWTTPPWSLYAREYMPYDGPGIGPVRDVQAGRGFPPHLAGLHDGFLESR